jgi:cell shape-determining protein MreC
MKLKLLRRRLTISAPRMAVRSALPWPLRWLLLSVVLGFSAATMLWAYEFGRDIAGLDRNIEQELSQLRTELEDLRTELAKAQLVANTSESLLTAEKAAQSQLLLQIKQLETDNQALRSDLGFFERLIPGTGSAAPTIRGLQVERLSPGEIKWQALVMQATKNAPEFKGSLDVTFSGTLDGRPWSVVHGSGAQAVLIKSYLRQEGVVTIPPAAVVKTVTARVLQGGTVKSTQTIKL